VLKKYQRWPNANGWTRGTYEENAMKGGNKLFIFTGIALALVTVLLAITMTSGGNEAPAKDDAKPGKVKIVKAAVDFEPHKVVSMSDIVVEEMASDQVPDGAVNDTRLILGQSYKLGAVKGDILLASYVEAPGIRNSIEAGKRAVSLEVDNQGMMSGLIQEGDYVDVVFKARVDLARIYQGSGVEIAEDSPPYVFKDIPTYDEQPQDSQQFQGADGSEFIIMDAGHNLEPVAKLLVQDVKVVRTVAPGVHYDGQGQQVSEPVDSTTAISAEKGQLILEVSPEQAEAISFMQDQNMSYEVTVRGDGDHESVKTTGITFQILMSDKTWSMPWPKPMFAPGDEDYPGGPAGDDEAQAESANP
jgi:Flp pilus assembly protein CpaB